MSTLDTTMSMLEVMPEDARLKVFEFTQQLFSSKKPANPFMVVGEEQIFSDLAESRKQCEAGYGMDMKSALEEMGKKHGFV